MFLVVSCQPSPGLGALAHLINDILGDFFHFWLLSRPFPLFPSPHLTLPWVQFPFLYFFSLLFLKWVQKRNLRLSSLMVFNCVLINIYGLSSHPSLRISTRVMKVYINLTQSPKLKYKSPVNTMLMFSSQIVKTGFSSVTDSFDSIPREGFKWAPTSTTESFN